MAEMKYEPGEDTGKDCRKCGTRLVAGETITRGQVRQRSWICRKCHGRQSRAWEKANPDAKAATTARWRRNNPKALAAQRARYHAKNKATPEFRARRLLLDARGRERAHGVPEWEQLDIEAWLPIVTAELERNNWGFDLEKTGKRGPHWFTPTLSRIDDTNPAYTGNFVVEPMCVNTRRKRGDKRGRIPEDTLRLALKRWRHLIKYEPLKLEDHQEDRT